ncbi:MAG: alpha/beta hydrolase [Alphaproteobacteria bacterium]|nr:alpha/beta hydrolase [Alphaproteobacteria bacterium]
MEIALLGAAVYLGLVGLLYLGQRSLLYFPSTERPDMAAALPGRWISVTTSDGLRLHGWWIPPADDSRPVVLLFHGNAIHIGPRAAKVPAYLEAGWGVLLAEYRGYGGNPGLPYEEGLYRDGRAYMAFVIQEVNRDTGRIVLYGESLGSGVATQMALEHPGVRALILDAPFDSALAVARWRFPLVPFLELMFHDHYRNDLKIAQVDAPVFIGVGGKDTIIPPRFGRALYAAAVEPKALGAYAEAGHLDLQDHGFAQDTVAFVDGRFHP